MVIDWKQSKAHLLLLSKYIQANSFDDFARHDFWKRSWASVLGELPEQAIKRFIDEGLLVVAGLYDKLFARRGVADLKVLLKQRSLPVSGRKEEMVVRLVKTDPMGMDKEVTGLSLLKCSQLGIEIVEKYLAIEKEKREKIEKQVIDYLKERKFKEASLTVASYEAEQVFPRGISINWTNYNPNNDIETLTRIFSNKLPKIISCLRNKNIEAIKITSAMMVLWGENKTNKWLLENCETDMPFSYDTVVRMVSFYSIHKAEIEADRKSGVVKGYEIASSGDSCESCKKLNGKQYDFTNVPELPYEHCTHKMGCRCSYRAILK